jgi:hypothetical protein
MHFTLRPLALFAAPAVVGFATSSVQLVLLRELVAVFCGNELAVVMIGSAGLALLL